MNAAMLKRSALLAVFSLLVAAAVLSTATYAWFTSNRSVTTGRVETSTDVSDLTLYVKAPSDRSFSGSVCELSFSGGDELALLPVSTADLRSFVYCPGTISDQAKNFVRLKDLENQNMLCYGSLYMRAELSGDSAASARVAVYLDQDDPLSPLAEKTEEDSLLLNAARLGIAVHGQPDTARIFLLSEEENGKDRQVLNTFVDGQLQPEGIVLKSGADGTVTPVADPAVPLSTCMLTDGPDSGEPLFYLEPNTDYQIDVFFYLEGCDPDCSDSIEYNAAEFGLAFYATLASGG